MSDKLLPCPFCGGKATSTGMSDTWIGDGYGSAYCTECEIGYYECKTESDAIGAWNRRDAARWPAPTEEAAEQLARAYWHESVEQFSGTPWNELAERVREVRTEMAAAVLTRLQAGAQGEQTA